MTLFSEMDFWEDGFNLVDEEMLLHVKLDCPVGWPAVQKLINRLNAKGEEVDEARTEGFNVGYKEGKDEGEELVAQVKKDLEAKIAKLEGKDG